MCRACSETGLLSMIVLANQREIAGGNVIKIFCSCDKGDKRLQEIIDKGKEPKET